MSIYRIWDARKLQDMPLKLLSDEEFPRTYGGEAVETYMNSKKGQDSSIALWEHGKSVSAAYWDPRGRSIVSTSYDDKLRREYLISSLT